jgi:nucleotide-binding universal stress UspA family protein
MIRHVLVALDTSVRAEKVFGTAVALARAFGSRVTLFRAVAIPPEFPPSGPSSHQDPLAASWGEQAQVNLESMARSAPDLHVTCRVQLATQAWRAILAVADELQADLIVLGSHGYAGWDRILGTTAGKVSNRARCDVLIVHARA